MKRLIASVAAVFLPVTLASAETVNDPVTVEVFSPEAPLVQSQQPPVSETAPALTVVPTGDAQAVTVPIGEAEIVPATTRAAEPVPAVPKGVVGPDYTFNLD